MDSCAERPVIATNDEIFDTRAENLGKIRMEVALTTSKSQVSLGHSMNAGQVVRWI